MIIYINSQFTNEGAKHFKYLYVHPYMYLVWQNVSVCQINCLAVWLPGITFQQPRLKTHFISQVISDVFGAPVFVSDIPNSAALGSCYRAKHGVYQRRLWVLYLQSICMSCNFHIHVHVSWFEGLDGCDFSDVVLNHPQPECVARPTEGANQVSRSSRSFWTDVHLIKKM